jgi:hypothetical protein
MPAKLRTAKGRRPQFSPEAIALFRELDAVPMRRRKGREWDAAARQLSVLLDLESEWFCSAGRCCVLDRSSAPHCMPDKAAYETWFRTKATRELLLESIAAQDARTEEALPSA